MNRGRLIGFAGVVVVVATLCIAGCGVPKLVVGSGNVIKESRPVSGFRAVELAGPGELFIQQGQEESLRVEAEDNLIQYFTSEVVDGTLKIGLRGRVGMNTKQTMRFYVTAKHLDTIIVSSLATVTASALETAQLTVRVGDGGRVKIETLMADRLVVHVDGLSSLSIASGEVGEQDLTVLGGAYEAEGLQSARASARLAGLGSATVRVSEHLQVDIQEGGTVQYAGNPIIEQEISGLGQLKRIGD
ncbi:MAG: DUF2807 domain-containing protein [Anaerolineae bacterium]